MSKKTLLFTLGLISLAGAALAAAAAPESSSNAASAASYFSWSVVAAAFGLGIAALGGAIGQGIAISKAVEGIARNPEASGKIMTTMIVGLALIESLAIYTLVVVLILLYAKPFGF
jgi:F-type H+-transporting ATPase subunit c